MVCINSIVKMSSVRELLHLIVDAGSVVYN